MIDMCYQVRQAEEAPDGYPGYPATPGRCAPAAAHPPATRPKPARQHSGNRSANAATVGLEQAAPAITSRPASTHPPDRAAGPAALSTSKHHTTRHEPAEARTASTGMSRLGV